MRYGDEDIDVLDDIEDLPIPEGPSLFESIKDSPLQPKPWARTGAPYMEYDWWEGPNE